KMAPYLMNEDFTSTKPLEKLSTDVSYIQCSDGLLYLSAIKDLFNNEIIAYSLSTKNNIELLKDTMKRLPKASSDIAMINSDQGSLYYSG
ncbi:DDE-type integrase/transposase/recombinase, partial [Erysipelothrix rhusiopathiae]